MKSSTTISHTLTFRKDGAQSPVFVAGTFSDPKWAPCEMQAVTTDDGGLVFTIQLMIEPAREYQFKFKVGDGVPWVLDDDSPKVTDESGETVNLLRVVSQSSHVENDVPGKAHPFRLSESPTGKALATNRAATPIDKVAKVAAEVADTAAQLDEMEMRRQPVPGLEPLSIDEQHSASLEELLQTPLFAHESFGAYEIVDDGMDSDEEHGTSDRAQPRTVTKSKHVDDRIDMADPTLERFPTDKSSVMSTLRKIQSSRSEDMCSVEESNSRRTSMDSTDESLLSSLGSLSPTSSRKRENRLSHGSGIGGNKSATSLGCIDEEPKGYAKTGTAVSKE